MNSLDPSTAQREILWNVSGTGNVVVMYLLYAISMCIFAYGLWSRFKLWSAGTPARDRLQDWKKRFVVLMTDVVGQRKVNKERNARVFHSLILWGFVILLFTTTMVFIDHDLGIRIYQGRFYLGVTILSDLFGLALLVGLVHLLHYRYLDRPDRLHSNLSDAIMIILLAVLVVQGFLLEGLRIAATDDPWALYSPVGWLVAQLFWGLSENGIRVLHFGTWWFHAVTTFAFIAIIPYTKFLHIFTSSANLYFRNLRKPKGALAFPGDLEQVLEAAMESDEEFSLGINTLKDVSWKQRLDFDACTSCGRCQDVCPAYNSGKVLSPKWLILDSRAHMLRLHVNDQKASSSPLAKIDGSLLETFTFAPQPYGEDGAEFYRAANPRVQEAAGALGTSIEQTIAGEVMDADVFWSCTTCRACEEACPVGIEHVNYIVEARRGMALMQGTLPSEAQGSIRAIETRGNPFGPSDSRADWMNGLEVPLLESGDEVEVLYWVGCISAFDARKQKIARAMVQILNASGVSWGTLGNRECCTGDPARRLGEENVYQSSAKQNLATLNTVGFKRIVANCPHCFNSLKNEYPQLGAIAESREDIEIIHHSHFIQEQLDKGHLKVEKKVMEDITFHDPCYLGRYNDTYNEPREILVQLGSKPLKEMRDNRNKGMCCGAGGGHYWFDMKEGERTNVQRFEQVLETGASTVATACPFCLQMLEDGSKLKEVESQVQVKDIAELVASSLISSQ